MNRAWATVGMAVLMLGAGAAEAAIWDLTADWSNDNNPNGVWTLMKSQTVAFTINQPDYYNNGTQQRAWADEVFSRNAHVPFWMKSQTTGLISAHGAERDRTGSDYTSAVWTSPIDGTVQISGAIWTVWASGRRMDWQLLKNGVVLTSGQLLADASHINAPFDYADGSGGAAALSQTVAVGDRLELALISVSEGGNLGDSLGLTFQIAPEPATLMLWLFGGAAAFRRRRRTA
ncbi:MAG TPA: PEP-CTERM sorting domain-containing protein [Phycisphaerae bacterium]|nr:PEP-CTERM sorting domain-containing protein [Phycisphaerae bacterium]HRY70883.1 PEP-CTERM sorting domain-containing protein [Phycisphaerae bacterium]HSA30102.1 PEP-CTERM sorting domain-containing protein [Phycisphaerae bacterium]